MILSHERLKELVHYDPSTGLFTRTKRLSTRSKVGDVLGTKHSKGYLTVQVDGKTYFAHRLAVFYMEGYWPEHTVDHVDRDRANNKYENLREATHQCQIRNCKLLRNNVSGIKGVYWSKECAKWVVNIKVKRKCSYLGIFSDKLEAAYTRFAAEQCLGFQDCDINSSAKQFLDSQRR